MHRAYSDYCFVRLSSSILATRSSLKEAVQTRHGILHYAPLSAELAFKECCQRGTDVLFLGDYANITTIGGAIGPGLSTSTSAPAQSSSSLFITTTSAANTPFPVASTTSIAQATQTSPSPTPVSTGQGVVGGAAALTTGVTAGIAIGAVIVFAGLGLLGFFLYQQRNKTNKLKAQMELLQQTPDTGDSRQEVPAYGVKDQYYKDAPIHTAYEVEARYEMVEAAGHREIVEANAGREVGELPAETRRHF
ncbi:hypothetical protein DL98DRAFT_576699 [Cadophora sp. DSE1049]|nr:hypothetical protein DL98DRAFT_576699 [Cadophora sp. DSE1049]